MTKVRRSKTRPEPPVPLTRNDEVDIDGRLKLVKGRELSIRGERGRFRFIEHVVNEDTGDEWITVYGPLSTSSKASYSMTRSFSLDRVKTVHSKSKARS